MQPLSVRQKLLRVLPSMTPQRRLRPLLARAATAALMAGSLVAAQTASLVREQKALAVNGVKEIWRLEWAAPPSSVCGADVVAAAQSCACAGFAYGEAGSLSLVRLRPGAPAERLSLAPFFKDASLPDLHELAVLRRWPPVPAAADNEDDDWHHASDWNFLQRVQARGASDVMRLADYNHDGQASEFLLQVGTRPCGKRALVLVGVSRSNPRLHVFASAEAPNTPLELGSRVWEAVRKSANPVHVVEWPCENHKEGVESIVTVAVRRGVFHVQRDDHPCLADPPDDEGH